MSSHSHNTIRIALNDADVLKELLKDPEVVVRCKDAIVKGVAKYVVNAAQTELNRSIDEAILYAVQNYCQPERGKESEWFKLGDSWYSRVRLTDKAKEAIKSAVDDALLRKCFDIVKDTAENKAQQSMDIAIADKVMQIAGIDVEEALNKRLDAFIQERLRKRSDD